MKIRIVLLLMVAVFAVGPAAAAASCPQPESLITALEASNTAFVGRVVSTSDFDRIAEMRVIAVWKGGDLEEQITVWGVPVEGAPVSATDRRFAVGNSYLVIPENTRQPFLASSCSATQPFAANGLVIPPAYHDAVEATQGRAPLVASQPDTATPVNRRRSVTRTSLGEQPIKTDTPRQPKVRRRRFSVAGLLPRLLKRSGMRGTERNRKKRWAARRRSRESADQSA